MICSITLVFHTIHQTTLQSTAEDIVSRLRAHESAAISEVPELLLGELRMRLNALNGVAAFRWSSHGGKAVLVVRKYKE